MEEMKRIDLEKKTTTSEEYFSAGRVASKGRLSGLLWLWLASLLLPHALPAQNAIAGIATDVPLQPFALQVRQVENALEYEGQPLTAEERQRIDAAIAESDNGASIAGIENVLDPHVLAVVTITPESRVQVAQGTAKPELVEHGTRLFLVKVRNGAGVTAPLVVESPNSGDVFIQSDTSSKPAMKLTPADAKDRWMDISLFNKDPMSERLSGLRLEYRVLEVYSRDAGQRAAKISFNVGQGTQDIGFRNDMVTLFNCLPVRNLKLRVKDENGEATSAAFTIKDKLDRVYPNPSKRLAPDMFFEQQVYRSDGDELQLPAGEYTVTCWMGPEYKQQTAKVTVGQDSKNEISFRMERWINPASLGWFSADHHVHAAGCSHYQNPTQGVEPSDMIRQVRGEKLNIGAVLTWGPCYYYQKQFFSGKDDPHSSKSSLIHYDVEISGFPSSHAGHLVLLGLHDQDYPGAKRIEDWPTWDLPVLRWAKDQHAVTGFAHSGYGLAVATDKLPNYEMPGFDGIGSNEYIVDVTYPNTVDFTSAVDTPYVWELNIWYHTLNVGFRTRLSGETDFPCISDSRVGLGRVYTKLDGPLSYDGWLKGMQAGRSYVSDGRSHLMDFAVNGLESGTANSEVRLSGKEKKVEVSVNAAAYLDPQPDFRPYKSREDQPPNWVDSGNFKKSNGLGLNPTGRISSRPYTEKPYWDIERARIGDTREVPVQLVVNGIAIAQKAIVADGTIRKVTFSVPVEQSSWMAVRILGSAHSNPIFVLVDGKPIRASRASAQWCLNAVNQCWTQKSPKISSAELPQARQAYDHAREVYEKLASECSR